MRSGISRWSILTIAARSITRAGAPCWPSCSTATPAPHRARPRSAWRTGELSCLSPGRPCSCGARPGRVPRGAGGCRLRNAGRRRRLTPGNAENPTTNFRAGARVEAGMRHQHLGLAGVAPALALLAACASGIPLHQSDQQVRDRYNAYAGEPIDHLTWLGRYDGWEPIGRYELVVFTGVNDAYLLKVMPPCENLQFAN